MVNIHFCYLQQLSNWNYNVFQKLYRYLFGIITIKKTENDIIMFFPNYNKWVLKKMNEILYNENIVGVVLAKSLKDDKIKNNLYAQNLQILDGRILFEILIYDCLKYILKLRNKSIENAEITILINDLTRFLYDNIVFIANKVKVLNIVTNNISKFKSIEEKIREKFGTIIRISNNKRKSLINARIIFNVDFPEELINKYQINQFAIFINISNKIIIYSKRFCGININNYCIKIKSNKILSLKNSGLNLDFDDRELYESIILKNRSFYEIRSIIEHDELEITALIGNNGIINENEYKIS